jgi:acyl-CoA synthetase (AMP-forming)/AMP-acid ligase II
MQPDRSVIDENGWLKTGDIGFFDKNCNIYVVERENFLFKYYMSIVSDAQLTSKTQYISIFNSYIPSGRKIKIYCNL